MSIIKIQRTQLASDVAANWTAVNPILAVGEIGYETDGSYPKIKIGDGVTAWSSLTKGICPTGGPGPTGVFAVGTLTATDIICDTGTAWTTYTPTITAGVGTFTAVSATGRYKRIGKTVFCSIDLTITTNGSASGAVRATIPVPAYRATSGTGREYQIVGFPVFGAINVVNNYISLIKIDNSYPGGTGYQITVDFTYEAA